jgi:hypothetical protein
MAKRSKTTARRNRTSKARRPKGADRNCSHQTLSAGGAL